MAKPTTSRCLIEIQIDRPDYVYKPGERITGKIEILPGADQKCRKVTLTMRWVARGKGPEDSADHETIPFPGGAWRNNEKVTHAFDLAAPRAPLSYEGDSFDVRWYLVAEADLPVTKDALAVRKFTLAHGPETPKEDFSWQTSGAYNPFAALGSETAKATGPRQRSPAFYTALSWVPGLLLIPFLAVIVLCFIGLHELEPDREYLGDVIWSLVFIAALYTAAAIFRRKALAKRRDAQNRQNVLPPNTGDPAPRPPGKFWLKVPPDDSQRGWPRSIASLSFGGVGLLLMVVGIINVVLRSWGPESAAFLAASIGGMVIAFIVKRGLLPSWRFIKTQMGMGHVEVGIIPEKIRCGDEVHVYVDFRTSLPVQIKGATATLEAYEVAEQYFRNLPTMDVDTIMERFKAQREQHKKFRFARVRQIHSQAVTLASERTLLPQESANLSGKFGVPADAPPTFLAVGNKILWFMAIRLKLASGITWSKDFPIFMQQ